MNYVQELNNAINNSNDQLIQTEINLDQVKNAAKLSLYYVDENPERNATNFTAVKVINDQSLSLDVKSVQGISLANNALTAAKQFLIDSGLATSCVSTAAANIQIAANSITKLSSDVAGVLAVANAADHNSIIQESVEKAHNKINIAAELAEKLSLISLQATIQAAQSTASTVVTEAELVLAAMTSLQCATSSQYSNSLEQLKAAHAGLMAASKTVKSTSVSYDLALSQGLAIKSTRKLINQVSNHNLLLFDSANVSEGLTKNNDSKNTLGDSFTIQFDRFEAENHIQNYRMIMVRSDASTSFDINIAKELRMGTYYELEPKGCKGYSRTFYLLGTDQALIPCDPNIAKDIGPSSKDDFEHMDVQGTAVDYQGKPIERGVYYVAYVYLTYTKEYRKKFDRTSAGYLSMPSAQCALQKESPKSPNNIESSNKDCALTLTLHQPNDYERSVDLSAQKAAAIYNLKRLVEDAKKSLAEAEAVYESFQEKSVLFDSLLNNSIDRITVMTDQNKLAVDTSQKVNSLSETVKTALQTANNTYSATSHLLMSVQQVVDATLDAATEVKLSAELIMKRKAANPLISSELVADASQAATDANKVVSLIINALTSSYNALSTASQANNTGEVVMAEVTSLKDLVVEDTSTLANIAEGKMPIETQVNVLLAEARSTERENRKASDQVQKSVVNRKNILTNATAKLASAEASLNAAMELQKPLA
tara:strand:- start:2074 stop:4209 length:2136 start_codon:yes stop_codon:yes gene_type:complete